MEKGCAVKEQRTENQKIKKTVDRCPGPKKKKIQALFPKKKNPSSLFVEKRKGEKLKKKIPSAKTQVLFAPLVASACNHQHPTRKSTKDLFFWTFAMA